MLKKMNPGCWLVAGHNCFYCRIVVLTGWVLFTMATALSQSNLYQETYRPQFHFSPARHWMNDPNGMFFYNGEYHLFFQYYPNGNTWGPMHWGHAISKNMVQWQQLPIALYPDTLGFIFSGSAVVDWQNSSGLGSPTKPPIVALYTYHQMAAEKAGSNNYQYQGLAWSNDNGRTWKKHPNNPVLPNRTGINDFRDPKVSWHAASKQWIMTLAVKDHIQFWSSSNLINWQYESSFGQQWGAHGGVWECPDLIALKIAPTNITKYVLLVSINPGAPNGGSGTQYFIGDFDGKQFVPEASQQAQWENGKSLWLDYGRDNYAGVTWSDVPKLDDRHLFLGWMSNWDYAQQVPTTVWRSAMTLPRTLSLHRTTTGMRLYNFPAKEIRMLRNAKKQWPTTHFSTPVNLTPGANISCHQSEWIINLSLPDTNLTALYLQFSNTAGQTYRIGYNCRSQQFFSDRTKAGQHQFAENFANGLHVANYTMDKKNMQWHFWMDASSIEFFADSGKISITDLLFPQAAFNHVTLHAVGGKAILQSATCYALNSIWPNRKTKK
jgi:fructan beta-fructosidase